MRPLRTLTAVAAAAALSGCRGIQTMLDPAADQAGHIDGIWRLMLVVCGLMYLLVLGFLAWALWRARRDGAGEPSPLVGRTAEEPRLERGLGGFAALIVAGLVVLTTASFLVDRSLAEVGPRPLNVTVTGNQWWWDVRYDGATPSEMVTTANELHLPVGRTTIIKLEANDVIHSFWVPNLSGKTDLIPGRTNYITLTPRRVGVFRGQCAEFCGLEHAKMALVVHVDDAAGFDAWRKTQLQPAVAPMSPRAMAGQQVFNAKACVMCHRIAGTPAGAGVGPDLTHLKSRDTIAAGTLPNSRGDLQAWIADPQGIKPGTAMPRVPLTGPELNAVVDYLETLK